MTTEAQEHMMEEAFLSARRAARDASGDRLSVNLEPTLGESVHAVVRTKPPGEWQWTTHADTPEVTLTRDASGAMSQSLRVAEASSDVDDSQAARALGVELSTWRTCRGEIEDGLSRVAGTLDVAEGSGLSKHRAILAVLRAQVAKEPRLGGAPAQVDGQQHHGHALAPPAHRQDGPQVGR